MSTVQDSVQRNVLAVIQAAEKYLGTIRDERNDTTFSILGERGTILYSSCKTLTSGGDYYFLGLNPGGSSEDGETLEESLRHLSSYTGNAYLDKQDPKANWSSPPRRKYNSGEHPFQRDYQFLFHSLGVDPYDVCGTNLIFKRSENEASSEYRRLAKPCWEVHKAILRVIKPKRAIITFGIKPFNFIRLRPEMKGSESVPHPPAGRWDWKHSILEDGTKLVGIRHPSRSARLEHNATIISQLKEFLELT